MRKNRSFHADIGRAVTAAVAAEACEDIDAALADAVMSLDSMSVSTVEPEKLRIGTLIGMGGYGSVWMCTDPSNSRNYALKMLRKGLLAGKTDLPKCAPFVSTRAARAIAASSPPMLRSWFLQAL